MKDGKKPLTDEELKDKLQKDRDEKYEEAKRKFEKIQRDKDESVKELIQTALNNKTISEQKLKVDLDKH